MRTAFIIICCSCLFFREAAAQSGHTAKDWYFKLSGGSVAFGTGVFEDGYGIGMDVSKNLVKIPKPGMGKFLVGGELLFEQGANSPKTGLITDEDFPQTSFSQVSAATLWPTSFLPSIS